MTRILIADDHEVVRSGLRKILEAQPTWEVVAEAADGKEALLKAIETVPNIAIIDYSLPILIYARVLSGAIRSQVGDEPVTDARAADEMLEGSRPHPRGKIVLRMAA